MARELLGREHEQIFGDYLQQWLAGLPMIGRVPGVDGLLLATGHFRNGILLAPVTARLVADLVLGKGLPDEAAAFSPARFANPTRESAS